VRLKELEEDCLDELNHILSVVKDDDEDPLDVPSSLLKQIAKELPRSVETLARLEGMNPAIMKYEEIILTITEEYQQMKRKILLKQRMMKNRERMKLPAIADSQSCISSSSNINRLMDASKTQIAKVKVDNLQVESFPKPLETIKIVLKSKKNKNFQTTFLEPEVGNKMRPSLVDVSETKLMDPLIVQTPQVEVKNKSSKTTPFELDVVNKNVRQISVEAEVFETKSFDPLTVKSQVVDVKPREIPVETISDETEVLDVVVAEVTNPSKIYIQKASEYDKLNKMMDRLDQHYQLVLKEKELGNVDTMLGKISVGDFVAITWSDNMWYRGKIIKYQDYQTLKVFYIDYGTTADIKRSCMFKLDANFFELPAQAIYAELAGIEPTLDEAQSVHWSGYPTRRVLELASGSHLRSLVAVITSRRKDKVGIWLLDHKGQGINETLVHEGFAKFIDTDENLMNMLSSGEDTNKEYEFLNRVVSLNEDILNLEKNEDPYKVRTILYRSWRLYEQLHSLIEDEKDF